MDILKKIYDAKLQKNKSSINITRMLRRSIKLSEETGEVSEATLGVTSPEDENYKNLTMDDLREELTDVIIVATDFLLSIFPDEEDMDYDQLIKKRSEIFDEKIEKWLSKKSKKGKKKK